MFSSNIVYNSENDVLLGVLYKNKATKLKKGAFIVIEDKATCVIVYKSNIMDFLYGKGKFRIANEDMPRLFEKIETTKDKDSKFVKTELYFIKATQVDKFMFCSDRAFKIKSREYGKITGWVEGLCSITITSVKDLFDWLFMIKRKFKNGKIDDIISEQIGNAVCKVIEKSKLDVKDIILNNTNINELLNIELANSFEDLGFEVKNFNLKGIEFHRKVQEKVNAIIQREYEKVDRTKTKYMTISSMAGHVETESELVLENENSNKVCTNCGEVLDGGYEFCPHCGSRLKM